MNASSDPTPPAGLSFPGSSREFRSPFADLVRRFFACNPFYLTSAGVLLWGLNRLSVEPKLAGPESAQILFNFTTLFAYEILLVITAIFLARRAIWEDAIVLVGLENLFVMIPFSLVSRAVLINQPLAQEMCVAGAVLAFAKFWALKRFIPELNLPARLLGLSGAALALNISLALLLQRFANDRPALHGWLALAWLIALPFLAASVVLLPRNRPTGNLPPQRAWLPFAMFGLWLVVTGFHLYGVGYVHDFPWRKALAAPTLLAVAWAVLLKTYSPVPNASFPAHRLLLCGPLATPFLALADTPLFFALHSFNVLAYWLFWRRQRFAKSALALAALSLVLATAGIPDVWLAQLRLVRIDWVLGVAALTTMIPMFCSRDPRLGFLGAVGCSILSGLVVMRIDCAWQWAAQAGIIFVLVHSLRWQDDKFQGARNARYFLGTLWVFVSFVWIRSDDPQAIVGCMIAGVVVLVGYTLYWLVGRRWQPVCVAVYAGIVASLSPSLDLVEMLQKIPTGFLAVLSSVPLFVAGTIVALMRHRWQRDNSKL